jgi:hypothetical protein
LKFGLSEISHLQSQVHGGKPEGQNRLGAPVPRLDLLNLGAQGFDGGLRPHGGLLTSAGGSTAVFLICSVQRLLESSSVRELLASARESSVIKPLLNLTIDKETSLPCPPPALNEFAPWIS